MNSNTLNSYRDPGNDAIYDTSGGRYLNANFGTDAAAYSLNYFANDYTPVASITSEELPVATCDPSLYTSLYNGNISAMVTEFLTPDTSQRHLPDTLQMMLKSYRYDCLNRLKTANSYQDDSVAVNNQWANAVSTNAYYEGYSYDRNGNITNLQRYSKTGNTPVEMDSLTYHYNYSGNMLANNRLEWVNDKVPASEFYEDIDQQNTNNYLYNQNGSLIHDEAGQLDSIKWNLYGKVSAVIPKSGSGKQRLDFSYDPMGNRMMKKVLATDSANAHSQAQFYARDAQGNILAIYTLFYNTQFNRWQLMNTENHIYGSSRLGISERNVITGLQYGTAAVNENIFSLNEHQNILDSEITNVANAIIDVSQVVPEDTTQLIIDPDSVNGIITHYAMVHKKDTLNLNGEVWMVVEDIPISPEHIISYIPSFFSVAIRKTKTERVLGNKQFELTNHLGNVLSTVSDRKLSIEDPDDLFKVQYYAPQISSAQDYYSFGMMMPGRSFSVSETDTTQVSQGTPRGNLVVTEISNGPTGNCEYIELFVASCSLYPDADSVDIRGWIIDDNSGNFNYSPAGCTTGVGISPGHLRFSESQCWAKVPVGKIIVLYNNLENCYNFIPDTIGSNGTFYIPVGNTALIEKSYRSSGTVSPNSDDCGYCGNAYIPANTSNSWNQIVLNNTNDAIQSRCPDCEEEFYHGLGYGAGFEDIAGTSNSIGGSYFSGSGAGRKYELTSVNTNTWQRSTANVIGTPPSSAGHVSQALNDSLLNPDNIPCCGSYTPIAQPMIVPLESYRLGFNGKEKDDETYGIGNEYDFGARIYDPRLGRWMSVDPLQQKYPSLNPYNFCANSPLRYYDGDGKVIVVPKESNDDVKKFFMATFGNRGSEMAKYVQSWTDANGVTYYTIQKDQTAAFIKAAGKDENMNAAARQMGAMMESTKYKLTIDTHSKGNWLESKSKYQATAHVDPNDNSQYDVFSNNGEILGEKHISTLNERLAHEAFAEGYFNFLKGDFVTEKNPSKVYDKVYGETFDEWGRDDMAKEAATKASAQGDMAIIRVCP